MKPLTREWVAKAEGDFATDLNGDGFVEFTDYTIWETNSNNFVGAFLPF